MHWLGISKWINYLKTKQTEIHMIQKHLKILDNSRTFVAAHFYTR